MRIKKAILAFICILLVAIAAKAQPVVDGTLNDAEYINMSAKLNANAGFGSDINITEILYYPDDVAGILYLAVKSKLNVYSDDGLGIFLNISGADSPTGIAAANDLGFSGAGHFIDGDGTFEQAFKADFEVDYAFAFNPGYYFTDVYWDAASYVGGTTSEYAGSCQQDGVSATNASSGIVFTTNSISFAFNNAGGVDNGLEMAIPYSELGATADMHISAFAFITGSSAYISDVTVPGNIETGNPGFNADFNSLATGPFHSSEFPLYIYSCNTPTGLNATAITGTSATISWDAVDGAIGYIIQFENDAIGNNKRKRVGADVTSFNVGAAAMSPGNTYVFAVKTLCESGNSDWSDAYYLNTPLRLANTSSDALTIFPNPNNGDFTIEFPAGTESEKTITIRNMAGEITLLEVVAGSEKKLPVRMLTYGLYVVTIADGSKIITQLVSVQ